MAAGLTAIAPSGQPDAGRSVSQSWFYKWKDGDHSPRRACRDRLKAEIVRMFAARSGKNRGNAVHRRVAGRRLEGQ
jgi:hypothetical protein